MPAKKANKSNKKKAETPVKSEQPEVVEEPGMSIGAKIDEIIQQAENERPHAGLFTVEMIQLIIKATEVVALAGVYAPVSAATLAPVYGSTQTELFHRHGMMAVALVAWLGRSYITKVMPRSIANLLPALAFWIPTIQFFLFQQSSKLPAPYGPLITELLTFYPLVFVSVFVAAEMAQDVDLSALGQRFAEHGPPLIAYLIYGVSEKLSAVALSNSIGSSLITSRLGLQTIIATFYSLIFPSKLILLAIPSLIFSAGFNTHVPLAQNTALLNSTLMEHNWMLIDRQESVTGYISVLENLDTPYRVMRCDHSLLGGSWTKYPTGYSAPQLAEPIYGVFTMLEAVRLVETADKKLRIADKDAQALVIGLGIGTTPSALITHGVNTTIVEIDHAVYDFAYKYFDLAHPHRVFIDDAVTFVDRSRTDIKNLGKYDYIVHDVFTGGAEPVPLFTVEFIRGLSYLLKQDGVIAINYAGDLSLPSPSLVVRTIFSVFPQCRIFREFEPEANSPSSSSVPDSDFTNMVIFCTKDASTPLTFRKPTKKDLLGSKTRERFLPPTIEISKDVFEMKEGEKGDEVLSKKNTKEIEKWHAKSAIGHWWIMRDLIPAVVWESW